MQMDTTLSDTWCGQCLDDLTLGLGRGVTGLCRVQCGGSSLSGLQVSFPGLLPLFTNFTALSSTSLALVHWFCTATIVKPLLLFHDPERNIILIILILILSKSKLSYLQIDIHLCTRLQNSRLCQRQNTIAQTP